VYPVALCDVERVQAVKLRGIMLTDKYSATHCWSAPHGNFAGIRFVVKSVNGFKTFEKQTCKSHDHDLTDGHAYTEVRHWQL